MPEIIDAAREAEFGLLDRIALDVVHGRRGCFLRKFADAWLHADAHNKSILRPAFLALIDKYSLQEDLEEEPGT